MSKYMSQIPPEPKPKAGPRKSKPKPAKARKIAFGPAVPTQKRASLEAREKKEMPKRLGRDPWGDKTRKDMEMPKVMGSTKAQRAASTLELMNDMRSRNLLRSRNLSRKPNKKGM